jgi:hypothetical protein
MTIILNAIICEQCKRELQPEDIGVDVDKNGDLVRVCLFCGNKVIVK